MGDAALATIPKRFVVFSVAAVAHAVAVLALWVGVYYADWMPISGRWWVLLAWLWFVWLAVLLLDPARTIKRLVIPVGLSIALLIPCVPTAFTFTVWAIGGFAP